MSQFYCRFILMLSVCLSAQVYATAETAAKPAQPFKQSPDMGFSYQPLELNQSGPKTIESGKKNPVTNVVGQVSQGKVIEVIHGDDFSFLQMDVNGEKVWIAGIKVKAKAGDILSYTENVTMNGFTSKTLGRTFDKIIFVSEAKVVQ